MWSVVPYNEVSKILALFLASEELKSKLVMSLSFKFENFNTSMNTEHWSCFCMLKYWGNRTFSVLEWKVKMFLSPTSPFVSSLKMDNGFLEQAAIGRINGLIP